MSNVPLILEPITYSDIHLHGMFFAPQGECRAAILLVPPLFEEKRCAHRALTTCAQALARAGAAVLHPDLFGTGNSQGRLTDIALDRWIDDLHAARDYVRDRSGHAPSILGCRAGALLAAHAIAEGLPTPRLTLLQPVTAGRGYLNQLRTRRMIQDKMTGDMPPEIGEYEVEGQLLSPTLYSEFQALRLPAEMPDIQMSLLQCSFNEKLLSEYERLVAQWGAERVRVRSLVCEPFWNPHSPHGYPALAQAIVEELLA